MSAFEHRGHQSLVRTVETQKTTHKRPTKETKKYFQQQKFSTILEKHTLENNGTCKLQIKSLIAIQSHSFFLLSCFLFFIFQKTDFSYMGQFIFGRKRFEDRELPSRLERRFFAFKFV
jgi:hypothetical protein